MYTNPDQPFVKTTPFRIVFSIGLLLTLIAGILRIVYINSDNNCGNLDNLCINYYYNTIPCVKGNNVYCCGYGGGGYQYCGNYNSCYLEQRGYDTCYGLIVAEYILDALAVVTVIVLIVMMKKRRSRLQAQALAAPNGLAPNPNMIFTDQRPQINHNNDHSNRNVRAGDEQSQRLIRGEEEIIRRPANINQTIYSQN